MPVQLVSTNKSPKLSKVASVRVRLADQQNWKCFYCTRTMLPYDGQHHTALHVTFDHIVLKQHGGNVSMKNGVAACFDCNRLRGTTPWHAWLHYTQTPDFVEALTALEVSEQQHQAELQEINKLIPALEERKRQLDIDRSTLVRLNTKRSTYKISVFGWTITIRRNPTKLTKLVAELDKQLRADRAYIKQRKSSIAKCKRKVFVAVTLNKRRITQTLHPMEIEHNLKQGGTST